MAIEAFIYIDPILLKPHIRHFGYGISRRVFSLLTAVEIASCTPMSFDGLSIEKICPLFFLCYCIDTQCYLSSPTNLLCIQLQIRAVHKTFHRRKRMPYHPIFFV